MGYLQLHAVPETNHVSKGTQCCSYSTVTTHGTCNATSHAVSHFYISTLQSKCAMPNMAVFCSSLILCFPQMLNRYSLNDSEMVPVTRYYGYRFTFHMHCISFVKSSNFRTYYYYYYYYYINLFIYFKRHGFH